MESLGTGPDLWGWMRASATPRLKHHRGRKPQELWNLADIGGWPKARVVKKFAAWS